MDPGQFGAVGGRDRRADRTVALSCTDAVTQTACWEEHSQVCDEIRLTLAEVRRRTPSAVPAWGPRGTTPRLTVRGTAAGAPPPPPPHITSHHITSHHITSHHITSHHITSHHITSYHITSHHITSHHITSHYITSHYITSHHITSHHITSHHITSHHITSHHITSHHITSHHITSHHITSHHITSHHITSHHITSHHITSHHITSHHITSHHITSHHITSHHITSHHITSHHVTSRHVTSHHITSHHITSHHITSHHIASHRISSHPIPPCALRFHPIPHLQLESMESPPTGQQGPHWWSTPPTHTSLRIQRWDRTLQRPSATHMTSSSARQRPKMYPSAGPSPCGRLARRGRRSRGGCSLPNSRWSWWLPCRPASRNALCRPSSAEHHGSDVCERHQPLLCL